MSEVRYMHPRTSAMRLWRSAAHWLWTLWDALPPYHKVEGLLEDKETGPNGKPHVTVSSVKVEVDSVTFDTLVIGENLRVRYTRGRRAINIDRLIPGRGPG